MPPAYYGWTMFMGRKPYREALSWQERMVTHRRHGAVRDTLFFLSHPDVYTIGRDIRKKDIPQLDGVETYRISRGGGITYHGPGQLVVYPVFDIKRRGGDLHKFIFDLEEGIMRTFSFYGLTCRRNDKYTGVWVNQRKIASIGIAVRRWITFHGAAINLTTDLGKFKAINPCGLNPEVMTSAEVELRQKIDIADFAEKLTETYSEIFDTAFSSIDMEELAEIISMEESTQTM